MRSKYLLMIILCVTALVAITVLIGANSARAGTFPLSRTASKAQDVQTQRTQVKTEVDSPKPSTVIRTPSIETPLPDGQSLLQSRCTQCHELRRLQQIKKSRTEWAKSLSRMEWLNVRLSDTEKTVLLDYLAMVDKP